MLPVSPEDASATELLELLDGSAVVPVPGSVVPGSVVPESVDVEDGAPGSVVDEPESALVEPEVSVSAAGSVPQASRREPSTIVARRIRMITTRGGIAMHGR